MSPMPCGLWQNTSMRRWPSGGSGGRRRKMARRTKARITGRRRASHTGEEMPMVTVREQIAEAHRELALRRQCYPAWVQSGKLAGDAAMRQLQAMEAIVRTLETLEATQGQMALFARAP